MKNNIGPENVPLYIDYSIVLTSKNILDWEKVPWSECSKQENVPPEKRRKYTKLGDLRFCEGWLYDDFSANGTFHREWYWAKAFKAWFNLMRKFGKITDTRECEGCKGSFWKIREDVPEDDILPGFWVVSGMWWFKGRNDCLVHKIPPPICQWDQYRFNRRTTIQLKVWGKTGDKMPMLDADMQAMMAKRGRPP